MKRILYTLAIFIGISTIYPTISEGQHGSYVTKFVSRFKSIKRLMNKGDYETAMLVARKRLQRRKKRTKNVKFLEESFSKLQKQDLKEISFLKDVNKPENLDKIYYIYSIMADRQHLIEPLLPLVSKDGYKAEFRFLRVEELMKSTSALAAKHHYDNAIKLLALAEKGDKWAARNAYDALSDVNKYFEHYKDVYELKRRAIALGKTRVLVRSANTSNVSMPLNLESELLHMNVKHLNSRWTEFYTTKPIGHEIDVVSEIELRDFHVSPEIERIREFVESKEVQDGFEYFYDSNGNVAKDTLGNDIKKPKMITVFADVLEIKREKTAIVSGNIKFYNKHTNEILQSKSFTVESFFKDNACSFRGDERAISNNINVHRTAIPKPFPTDEILALDAAEKMKEIMKSEMKRFII